MYDPNGIFAKILRGEIPCHRVYEDEHCLAFMDIMPVNPGHFLVIPKVAVESVAELDEDLAAHLMRIGARLSKALRQTEIRCQGVNFWISDGRAAGQEVFHVHLHVIPRFENDGFGWKVGPHNRQPLPHPELAALADQIKAALM